MMSADEVEVELINELGPDLGRALFLLQNQIYELDSLNRTWRYLYVENEERFNLLQESAPDFFRSLDRILHHSLLLGISRLLDPSKTMKKSNLSMHFLTEMLPEPTKSKYTFILTKAKNASEFARDWRNKIIAHKDFYTAFHGSNVLSSSALKINSAIEVIVEALNKVHSDLRDTTIMLGIAQREPAESIVELLFRGLTHQKVEKDSFYEAVRLDWVRAENERFRLPDFIWSKDV